MTQSTGQDSAEVGILMLDTRFPRIHGDIGNPRTFPFPVRYHVVPDATPAHVVASPDRVRALLPGFVAGARALERAGVRAIGTSCGFLSVVQADLAAAVRVPVLTSSLFLVPMILATGGGRPIGIVTASAAHLSPEHLSAAGIRRDHRVIIRGLEDCAAFRAAILGDGQAATLDVRAVEQEVTAVCQALRADHPDLAAIVFECTNLHPYARAVQRAVPVPVYGIVQAITLLQSAAHALPFDRRI